MVKAGGDLTHDRITTHSGDVISKVYQIDPATTSKTSPRRSATLPSTM